MAWILGDDCVVCGRGGAALCAVCAAQLVRAARVPPIPGIERVAAVFDYAGMGRDVVKALKFRNRRAAVRDLGRAMALLVPADAAFVTWAPTTNERRGRRGYDQAELLARAVARARQLPCRPTLVRRSAEAQMGRGRAERLEGPQFAPRRAGINQCVVVVDDVITTGSTLRRAAEALHFGGATAVHAVGLAYRGRFPSQAL